MMGDEETRSVWEALNALVARIDALDRAVARQSALTDVGVEMILDQLSPTSEASRRRRHRLRQLVVRAVPPDSAVVLASKGEPILSDLPFTVSQFPQTDDGSYAGFHLGDSLALIAHLESVRARGAEYLVIPDSTIWWLDHYLAFRNHLENHCKEVASNDEGRVYALKTTPGTDDEEGERPLVERLAPLSSSLEDISALDWDTGASMTELLPGAVVFSPPVPVEHLPYLDKTIDVVAFSASRPERLSEAQRVALRAVVSVSGGGKDGAAKCEVVWASSDTWRPSVSIVIARTEHPQAPSVTDLVKRLPRWDDCELIFLAPAPADDELPHIISDARVRYLDATNSAAGAHAAVDAATGEVLVFLDACLLPLPGWLPPLTGLLGRPGIGAVTGRVLHRDGRLRSAGGILSLDGAPARRGEGLFAPDSPEFGYVTTVDFAPAELLATRRSLFREVGGLVDGEGRPDAIGFAIRLAERGFSSAYQPECIVVDACPDVTNHGQETWANAPPEKDLEHAFFGARAQHPSSSNQAESGSRHA